MPRIAIIDYGMGNLRSVQKAFEHIGVDAEVTADADTLKLADGAVLPGVGAYADCMRNLTETGIVPFIHEFIATGRPFLGICLGMQLFFESSLEGGLFQGLGIFAPHMGWNSLRILQPEPLLKGLPENPFVYFVHSYHAEPADPSVLSATADYGIAVTAAAQRGNIYGTQFHPEKSGDVGLQILRNFSELL
jgi:glutamine amidotransferase